MSTRISQEARIRRYFSSEELGKVVMLLNVIKDIVGERVANLETSNPVPTPRRQYKKRKKIEAPTPEDSREA